MRLEIRVVIVVGDYLDGLALTPGQALEPGGVALHGPHNKITTLTKRFPLLG